MKQFSTMTDSTDRELLSFLSKFRQLLSAGKTAKLVIDSQRGCARVNLEVFLDPADLAQEQQHHHRVHRRAGGPVRARRRGRRDQARQAAAQVRSPQVSPPPPSPNTVVDIDKAANHQTQPLTVEEPVSHHPEPHYCKHYLLSAII